MKPIKSSNLKSAEYDEKSKKLKIAFPNGVYEYENVSPELYKQFEDTFDKDVSSGQFFTKNIRPLKFKKL